jgi:excinuclease UvrABC helicase subunit UvrB
MTEEEKVMREKFQAVIEEKGIEFVKEVIWHPVRDMVSATKSRKETLKEHGFDIPPLLGYRELSSDRLAVGMQCIIEAMSDSPEKDELQEALDYWVANIDEILKDHRLRQ